MYVGAGGPASCCGVMLGGMCHVASGGGHGLYGGGSLALIGCACPSGWAGGGDLKIGAGRAFDLAVSPSCSACGVGGALN